MMPRARRADATSLPLVILSCFDGSAPAVPVLARRAGLALHRCHNEPGLVITHEASGWRVLFVTQGRGRLAIARSALTRLAEAADWSLAIQTIQYSDAHRAAKKAVMRRWPRKVW